ncbi:MAG: amidohydrolase [Dehalococcoidia bacterium]|nr:amidohydrolase [Dehalococcoidia bacterium]MYD51044.1 amidohydrolase [Dehalococcoidia bacterium]
MTIDVRDKLLDAHIHVHSPDFTKYPLAPGFERSDLWYPSMTTDDYAGYARRFGTVRANLVQPTWYGLDHTYIIDCIARAPDQYVGTGIVPAVSDVALPPPDRAMLRLSQQGIRAFRIRGGSARGRFGGKTNWLDYPGYDAMFEAAANHGLALSFLIGPDDLPEIDRMCSRFPDTRVVIDHVAGIRVRDGRFPADHVDTLCSLARHRNVTVKLGPLHVLGDQPPPFLDLLPLLRRVIDAFGPDRCMWETDIGGPVPMSHPEEVYAATVKLILDHADFLSDGDRESILYRTAQRMLFWG